MHKGIKCCTAPPVVNFRGFSLKDSGEIYVERKIFKITKQDIKNRVFIDYSKRYTVELDIHKDDGSSVDEIDLSVVKTYTLNVRIITTFKTFVHKETLIIGDSNPPIITWKWGVSSESDPSGPITWKDECPCASKNFTLDYGTKSKFYIAAYAKDLDEFQTFEGVSDSLAAATSHHPIFVDDVPAENISVWTLNESAWYFNDSDDVQRLSKNLDVVSISSTDAAGNSRTINITVNVVDKIGPRFYFEKDGSSLLLTNANSMFKEKSSILEDQITEETLKEYVTLYDMYPDGTQADKMSAYNVTVSDSNGLMVTVPFYPLNSKYTIIYTGSDLESNPSDSVSRTICVTDSLGPVILTGPLTFNDSSWSSNWTTRILPSDTFDIYGGGRSGALEPIRYFAKNESAVGPHVVTIPAPDILVYDESGPMTVSIEIMYGNAEVWTNIDDDDNINKDGVVLETPDSNIKSAFGGGEGELVHLRGSLTYNIDATGKDYVSFKIRYTFSDAKEKKSTQTQEVRVDFKDTDVPLPSNLAINTLEVSFSPPTGGAGAEIGDGAIISFPIFYTIDRNEVNIKSINVVSIVEGTEQAIWVAPTSFINTITIDHADDSDGMTKTSFGGFTIPIRIDLIDKVFQWYKIPTIAYQVGEVKITVEDTSENKNVSSITLPIKFVRSGTTSATCTEWVDMNESEHNQYCKNRSITNCGPYCTLIPDGPFNYECCWYCGFNAPPTPEKSVDVVLTNLPCDAAPETYLGNSRPFITNAFN